ncbi:MAG: restriction endonuclease subunit S, partial [Clostridia bacterium]|nr:restriction endonuclease subunit S [Clostridia bacterium]
MIEIEKKIQELCPNGVEYVELGEICEFIRGKGLCKDDIEEQGSSVILYGELYTTYGDYIKNVKSHVNDNKIQNSTKILYGDILLPLSSTTKEAKIGKASVFMSNEEAYLGGDALLLRHNQDSGYLMYVLNSSWFEKLKMKCVSGTTINHLSPSKLARIQVPLPPLAAQREIVRVLDKFTLLSSERAAELAAELAARRVQYEYYRDKLLSCDKPDIEWLSIEELFTLKGGYTPSKDNPDYWENGDIPWFRLEDINQNGRILYEAKQHVTQLALKKSGLFKENSLVVTTSATIGEYALIKVPFLCNQRFTCLTVKDCYKDRVIPEFLLHYCYKLAIFCKEHLNVGNFASVDMGQFNKFRFPIPPMAVQKRLIEVLDNFDKICSDLKIGLPAEIEKRQQQYEYYRDKLLTFDIKSATIFDSETDRQTDR